MWMCFLGRRLAHEPMTMRGVAPACRDASRRSEVSAEAAGEIGRQSITIMTPQLPNKKPSYSATEAAHDCWNPRVIRNSRLMISSTQTRKSIEFISKSSQLSFTSSFLKKTQIIVYFTYDNSTGVRR